MIKFGITISQEDAEILFEMLRKLDIKKMSHEQLRVYNALYSVVNDNPIESHLRQEHDYE